MLDKETLDKSISTHYDSVLKYCKSKVNYNDFIAEDITQEVFLYMYEQHEFLEDNNLKSWLLSVARNKVYQYYDNIKKESFDDLETLFLCDNDDYFNKYFSNESYINEYKNEIINNLNNDEKLLIQMRYIDGLSIKEISEKTNKNETTISKRCLRLKNKMKKSIDSFIKSL